MIETYARIAAHILPDARLLRAESLTGGVSAQVTRLDLVRADSEAFSVLVRQHGAGDLADNPQIAADEYRLLTRLSALGLPTPRAYGYDESGTILPTPYIVVEYIAGTTADLPTVPLAAVDQLAAALATIHRADPTGLDFLPRQATRCAAALAAPPPILDESLQEGRLRAALVAIGTPPEPNRTALLHGDYWLGNTIWHDGALVGVIDWEDAKLGDPCADLGYARLEVLWTFGAAGLARFMTSYLALHPLDIGAQPYWDVYGALHPAGRLSNWGFDAVTEARMRVQHAQFVEASLAAL
jgi:aminoglycoside phosphotransferase (APT) family kinase protein